MVQSQPKKMRAARFDAATDAEIAALAEVEGRTWSDMLRRLVAEALEGRRVKRRGS